MNGRETFSDGAQVVFRLRTVLVDSVVKAAASGFTHPDAPGLCTALAVAVDPWNVPETAASILAAVAALVTDIKHNIPDDHGIMPEELFARHLPEALRELVY